MWAYASGMHRRKIRDIFISFITLDSVNPSFNLYGSKNWDVGPTSIEVSSQRNRKARLRVTDRSGLTHSPESALEKTDCIRQLFC
jgi:hypothetical protein